MSWLVETSENKLLQVERQSMLGAAKPAQGSGDHRGWNITITKVKKTYYWKTITARYGSGHP